MDIHQLFSPLFVNLANLKARTLVEGQYGLKAVVLATIDGFPVAAAMSDGSDSARIAALASSIASIGAVATQEAGLGRCTSVTLNTEQGLAVVRQFQRESNELVLILVTDGQALLAQAMYQANQLTKELIAA